MEYVLQDYLRVGLDLVFVGFNPSRSGSCIIAGAIVLAFVRAGTLDVEPRRCDYFCLYIG